MLIGLSIATAACFGGAFAVYRTLPAPAARIKLNQMFRLGDICFKRKPHKGKEIKKFPIIQRVTEKASCIEMVFSIPTGLDPKEIYKHDWLFKQTFGNEINLKGDAKTFVLNIYNEGIKPFYYDLPLMMQQLKKHRLGIVVGESRDKFESYDMTKRPHLLIAGETGSGKSTQLRSILTTLIHGYEPEQLELYLGDLKRSEFFLFDRVEHVKANVVDAKALYRTLLQISKEMKRRGDLLHEAEVAHVDDLDDKLPYMVVCIDEFALLKKEKDIMEIVEEISSIGRALGVFLILSCLRPDAEVLDGKLKQNLTVRMAFKHADAINSRITIGTDEAADIRQSDSGRMYLKMDGLKLVQAPHLELEDAKKLLEPFKKRKAPKEEPTDKNIDTWGVLDE